MMYIPRHWHWSLPVLIVLIGFYIHTNLDGGWDVILFVNWPLLRIAIEYAAYLREAGVAYQNYLTHKPVQKDPQPLKADPTFVPLVRDVMPKVETVVAPVRLDAEQKVARVLIDQRNHNFEIDMTEDYWIKGKHFDGTREEFVLIMEKWEYHGLSGRHGGQRKRVPKDWRQIRLVAQGEKLPPPPKQGV